MNSNTQLYSPHQAPLTASTMESTPQSQSKLDKRKMYCTGCTSQDKQQKLSLKKSNHYKLFLKSGVYIFHTREYWGWCQTLELKLALCTDKFQGGKTLASLKWQPGLCDDIRKTEQKLLDQIALLSDNKTVWDLPILVVRVVIFQ